MITDYLINDYLSHEWGNKCHVNASIGTTNCLLTSGMMSGGNACHPGCLGNLQNWEWNCLLYRSSGVISLRVIGGQKFPIFKVRGT